MDFKNATDELFDPITHEELAKALGVSVASIRQARLQPSAKAHRAAPEDWKNAVLNLAENRIEHYRQLVAHLRNTGNF